MKTNATKLLVAMMLMSAASRPVSPAQEPSPGDPPPARQRLLMDAGWRFAFGHATDVAKDFDHAASYFSYLAKACYGSGASGTDFDDRAWRVLNLPHDWAVEVPFDANGSPSHGFKAVGRKFPETSVGWYRKSFTIPASDLGKRISVEFDGVYRDSIVWINGHYLGTEESGYSSFARNLTEFLNYGGENVIAVRVDASLEEGWFYEGAGIYRHVWLVKTPPLHVERHGTFVTSELKQDSADVTARVTVINEGTNAAAFDIEQAILDGGGRTVARSQTKNLKLGILDRGEFSSVMAVADPKLWSIETPHMHTLVTTIRAGDSAVDRYETPFGIRSIRFDPNEGFFLNGKRVQIKGSNNHQDHAGVGAAIPDALQEFRIAELKKFGGNAYRASHNPPTPELLDACDRLGMLVIDENRLMGTADYHQEHLRRMIRRDRNHPCVILWSLGNEEWGMEGNVKGARIAAAMQAHARQLDPTRLATVAISGGWGGISTVMDVVGYNYLKQSNPEKQHKEFPSQSGLGTEETTTQGTRGVYFDDRPRAHLAPQKDGTSGGNAESGWKYYAARPFLAGILYWTGFDYRGEPVPFGWPAIASQFGILDTCGFPKDGYYYLKSWWTDEPVLHVFPHWNWPGREGQEIVVSANSNCEEIELFLNGRSLGRKTMEKNGHLEWNVKYAPGTLLARGYKGGKEFLTAKVETTGAPAAVRLTPNRAAIKADGEDVSLVTVQVSDAQGRMVPTAGNAIGFEIAGPGRIIGVGNGDPSSHEPDVFVECVKSLPFADWRLKAVEGATNRAEVAFDFDDSGWRTAFGGHRGDEERGNTNPPAPFTVYRGSLEVPPETGGASFALFLRSLGEQQSVYLNGRLVAENVSREAANREIALAADVLRPGRNVIAVVATARGRRGRGGQGDGQAEPGFIRMTIPPSPWKRSLFNGLAQVIVQSTGQPGEITLTARSPGVTDGALKLQAQPAPRRAAVR